MLLHGVRSEEVEQPAHFFGALDDFLGLGRDLVDHDVELQPGNFREGNGDLHSDEEEEEGGLEVRDLVEEVVAHGERDPPGQVDDAPEEVSEDEGLHWPNYGLGSGHVYIFLALHEVLDDLLGLVEVVDMPEIGVLKDALGSALN